MSDLSLSVIDQYDISVLRTLKGRGSIILETEQGYKRLIEYKGTSGRLEYMGSLLDYIYEHGLKQVDIILKNKTGSLLSTDECGDKYIITDWFYGNECDVKSKNNVKEGAALLAKLHNITNEGYKTTLMDNNKGIPVAIPVTDNLLAEYEKHNQELRRARGYIRGRKHKSQFEYNVLNNLDEYLDYAMEATGKLHSSDYALMEKSAIDKGSICHGNYNYHNIIFAKNKIAIVNFDKSGSGILIKDLYLYFRKVMEKYDWENAIGHEIIDTYNNVRSIPSKEYELLKIMLMYPEKFWKLVNHYYNSNKAWIPDKNLEKINKVCYQQKRKEEFISHM